MDKITIEGNEEGVILHFGDVYVLAWIPTMKKIPYPVQSNMNKMIRYHVQLLSSSYYN